MSFIAQILPYAQIALSVLLVGGILLLRSDASVGAAFGGDSLGGSTQHTKRGFEKVLFNATVIIAILFAITSFVQLLIR